MVMTPAAAKGLHCLRGVQAQNCLLRSLFSTLLGIKRRALLFLFSCTNTHQMSDLRADYRYLCRFFPQSAAGQ